MASLSADSETNRGTWEDDEVVASLEAIDLQRNDITTLYQLCDTEKDGSILMVSILGDTPKLTLHCLLQHAFIHLHIVHDDTLM